MLTNSAGHKKYQISPVNEFMTMADLFANSEKAKYMPSRILQSLADTIRDRTLYSHWQEVISTNNPVAQVTNNSHQHFIDVLEETRRILREKGNVPEMTSASLGKRKPSRPDLGGEKQKATKTMPWASETNQRPILAWRQADKQEPRQERDLVWRRGLAASGDKTESKLVSQQRTNVNRSCAAVVKPISYASALSVVKA